MGKAARAQQLALGLASRVCLFPALETPQLLGLVSSPLSPSSLLLSSPGEEAPPASPRGSGAAEMGTESPNQAHNLHLSCFGAEFMHSTGAKDEPSCHPC